MITSTEKTILEAAVSILSDASSRAMLHAYDSHTEHWGAARSARIAGALEGAATQLRHALIQAEVYGTKDEAPDEEPTAA